MPGVYSGQGASNHGRPYAVSGRRVIWPAPIRAKLSFFSKSTFYASRGLRLHHEVCLGTEQILTNSVVKVAAITNPAITTFRSPILSAKKPPL